MLHHVRVTMFVVSIVSCLTIFSSMGMAFDITYCGPYMTSSTHLVEGNWLTSQVTTDEPYQYVTWYVDGSYQSTSWGNGSTQSAYFSHAFYGGSTGGQQHMVKAVAFDWDSSSNEEDSYAVTVWSNMEYTSSPSRSVSNQMEVNGNYSVSFSMSTPSSNYRITRAEVWVGSSMVSSQDYPDVASASISASGWLGEIGQVLPVTVKFTWKISLTTIAYQIARYTWNVVLRCNVYGTCTCATDSNYLDSDYFSYGNNQYANTTSITWNAGSGGMDTATTSSVGGYSFLNVPCGYNITLTLSSTDTHHHGTGSYPPVQTCGYYSQRSIGQPGTVVWVLGWNWSATSQQENFSLNPL